MGKPTNKEANLYMKDYTNKIRSRFLSDTVEKQELLATLSDTERTPEKIKEINKQYHEKIKSFVHELKTEENFSKFQEQYKKDIGKIRSLLNDAVGTDWKKISALFPEAKKIFFEWDTKEWDSFTEKLGEDMKTLKKEEKENLLWYLAKINSNDNEFMKALESFKLWFDKIQSNDKAYHIFQILMWLLVAEDWAVDYLKNGNSTLFTIAAFMYLMIGVKFLWHNIKELLSEVDKHVVADKVESYKHLKKTM